MHPERRPLADRERPFDRVAVGAHAARSAGSNPAEHVLVEAMRELDIDVSDRVPRKLDRADAEWADLLVTMGCGDACPYIPRKRSIDWELDDPHGQPPGRVREIRDEIDRRVRRLVSELETAGDTRPPDGRRRTSAGRRRAGG